MRIEIKADSLACDIEAFKQALQIVADDYQMQWQLIDNRIKKKVILFVSKHQHCLADLLYGWREGEYHAQIVAVISNHEELRDFVEWHQIPFVHIPVPTEDRLPAFKRIEEFLAQNEFDVAVLARYMQILPQTIVDKYFGKIINIHHSFLPAFHGGNAYKQAYQRGVKIVGATCHYVSEVLDDGPIIEQGVIRIAHHHDVEDIARLTRDVEKNVLAKALHNHLTDRITIHGKKTIVFD